LESPADGKGRMSQKEYREKNNRNHFKFHGGTDPFVCCLIDIFIRQDLQDHQDNFFFLTSRMEVRKPNPLSAENQFHY
jgi:hypothetical protein